MEAHFEGGQGLDRTVAPYMDIQFLGLIFKEFGKQSQPFYLH
jgi:hypothetical protein